MVRELIFGLSILTSGLFCGLMMTLVFVMHKQWLLMEEDEYKTHFRAFLRVAKGHGLITFLTLYSFLTQAILGLRTLQSLQGILLLCAGLIFFLGCLVVTLQFNFPIYRKVVDSTNDAFDAAEVRTRFFTLNIIRFSASLATFILLTYAALFT